MLASGLPAKIVALSALLLNACASGSYWQPDASWDGFKPTQILLLEQDDPGPICRAAPQSVLGCAIVQREANQCTVVLRSRLPQAAYSCTLTHEVRHCFGDHHHAYNDRPHYAIDCGNGSMYSGPLQIGG